MRLTMVMAAGSLIVALSSNLFLAPSREAWIEASTLGSSRRGSEEEALSSISAWIHTCLAIFFTGAAFHTVFEMREEARNLYKENQRE